MTPYSDGAGNCLGPYQLSYDTEIMLWGKEVTGELVGAGAGGKAVVMHNSG